MVSIINVYIIALRVGRIFTYVLTTVRMKLKGLYFDEVQITTATFSWQMFPLGPIDRFLVTRMCTNQSYCYEINHNESECSHSPIKLRTAFLFNGSRVLFIK